MCPRSATENRLNLGLNMPHFPKPHKLFRILVENISRFMCRAATIGCRSQTRRSDSFCSVQSAERFSREHRFSSSALTRASQSENYQVPQTHSGSSASGCSHPSVALLFQKPLQLRSLQQNYRQLIDM